MTPLRLSYTWHRRFYVVVFLLSATLITLYTLHSFAAITVPHNLLIGIPALIGLSLTALASLIFFILAKKIDSFLPSFIVYIIFTASIAWHIVQSGGIESPLLIVWTLIAFFAALFGVYGWLGILVVTSAYIAALYLTNNLNTEAMAIISLSSLVPLFAGTLIWHDHDEIDESTKNVKNLANQLSEVASKSEIVINAIGDGVIAVDSKGVIQLINPAAQEILGWGKQDALMLSYKSILKLTDSNGTELDPAADPIQQVLNTNQMARSNKLIALTKSNKKISLALVVSPIGDMGGGVIIVFRDTTKERAEEREQAEFISTASHEMRTPVASIEGYMGLALNPSTAQIDDRARSYILKAHEAAQHLGRLFQDLLDVSKSEDGRLTNTPKVLDIVNYTETIVQGLTQKAEEKGLRLTFRPTESAQRKIMPVYYVNLDNDHIREVLDNLIENAIKYTPQGEVVVDVSGTDDKVIVSIKDSGLGIPNEDIPHLFQKFYRVDNADRQQIGGTGLGLYLSRRLAESMQGRLWVESVFGKGSTFFFELPRVESQEAERLKLQQEQAAKQKAQAAPVQQPTAPVSMAPQVVLAQPVAPVVTPVVAAPVQNQASQPPQPDTSRQAPVVRPATTVPRGESLTREQITERVRQLEAMAQQQRGGTPQ